MALQMALPTLLGVIIGGVLFLFCLAAAVVVLSLRIKHRKLLAHTNAAGERRLSRCLGGHLSITDEDVARIPGTGPAMRESLGKKRNRRSSYAPMASREDIEHRPGQRKLTPAPTLALNLPANMPFSNVGSSSTDPIPIPWPKSSGLTRANRPPAIKVKPTTNKEVKKPPGGAGSSNESVHQMNESSIPKELVQSQSPKFTYDSQGFPGVSPDLITFPSPGMKPMPLFHEKQRSISHSMISTLVDSNLPATSLNASQSQQHVGMRTKPRSVSLTSQEPGIAPREAIPPLPAEAVAVRRRGSIKAPGMMPNLDDNAGVGTTNPGGGISISNLRPEMNNNMIKLVPPSPAEAPSQYGSLTPNDCPLEDLNVNSMSTDTTEAVQRTLKAPLDYRRSVRTSLGDSIAGSNSSGLSESLLNNSWSRPASGSSIMTDMANALAKSGMPLDSGFGSHISVFDFGLPTNPDQTDVTHVQSNTSPSEVRNKRRSPSILQVIAGNEQNPRKRAYRERPLSVKAENSFDLTKELPAEKEITGVKANERQTLSKLPIEIYSISAQLLPERVVTAPQEDIPSSRSSHQAQSLRRPRVDPPVFCPPSSTKFDPELTPPQRDKATPDNSPTTTSYLKTLAKLTGSNDLESSPSSIISTPTRPPEEKRVAPGANPNRQRAIFDSPENIAQWPLARQHLTLSLGLRGISDTPKRPSIRRRNDRPNNHTSSELQDRSDPKPVSLLYRFPSPPSPTQAPRPPPKSQSQPLLHKPRSTTAANPGRRSPLVPRHSPTVNTFDAVKHTSSSAGGGSPGHEMRQSVIALRRMNSEISTVSRAGREHKRYLSLGEADHAVGNHTGLSYGGGREALRLGKRPHGPRSFPATAAAAAAATHAAPAPAHVPANKDAITAGRRVAKSGNDTFLETGDTGRVVRKVKGPRAIPGWINEDALMTPGKDVRVAPISGAVRGGGSGDGAGGSWYDADGFFKEA